MIAAILGAGSGGTAMAADLKQKGHTVFLLKTSSRPSAHFSWMQNHGNQVEWEENGKLSQVRLDEVSPDLSLVSRADIVVLFVQTAYQESVLRKAGPYLREDQVLLLEPGYLGSALVLRYSGGKKLTAAEAESSPIDCRIVQPGRVRVLFRNIRNPVGVYPAGEGSRVMERLKPLGYSFTLVHAAAEAALHNPNLIVHTLGGIMSIPRIEYTGGKGYRMYEEVFTPRVWNMAEALDQEKKTVLQRMGYPPISYIEACAYRNSPGGEQAENVFRRYARESSPDGPEVPDSRFITEDVPEGLVLLESLGSYFHIPTPMCTALIELASASCQTDFRVQGRTLERLGQKEVKQVLSDGGCLLPS